MSVPASEAAPVAAGSEAREVGRLDPLAHLVGDLLGEQPVLHRLVDPGERTRLLDVRVGRVELRLGDSELLRDVRALRDPQRQMVIVRERLAQRGLRWPR